MTSDDTAVGADPKLPELRRPDGWLARLRVVLVFASLFAVWEIAVRTLAVPSYVLPAPSVIATDIAGQLPALMGHAVVTAEEILYGYGAAILLGVPLAVAITFSRLCREIVYPVLVVSQVIPKIVLAPLFIIWFGIGILPKLVMTFLLCFFPIVLSSIAGFRSLEEEVTEFARTTGAGPWRQFRLIRFPHALPSIFVGLKLSATLAVIGAIVAEFVSSDRGLGYILMIVSGEMNTARVFSVIVILSVMGLLLYWAIEGLERLLLPWHASQRSDGAQ